MKVSINIFFVVVFLRLGSAVNAQLPHSAIKLVGEWKYKEGSGFERWTVTKEDVLKGRAYRVSKMRDTSIVEDLTIKRVNKNLVHIMTTYNVVEDSTIETTYRFIGGKRKLKFVNIDSNTPYSIQYKIGCLRRNKLFIKIKYGPNEKATKLTLQRVKA